MRNSIQVKQLNSDYKKGLKVYFEYVFQYFDS